MENYDNCPTTSQRYQQYFVFLKNMGGFHPANNVSVVGMFHPLEHSFIICHDKFAYNIPRFSWGKNMIRKTPTSTFPVEIQSYPLTHKELILD